MVMMVMILPKTILLMIPFKGHFFLFFFLFSWRTCLLPQRLLCRHLPLARDYHCHYFPEWWFAGSGFGQVSVACEVWDVCLTRHKFAADWDCVSVRGFAVNLQWISIFSILMPEGGSDWLLTFPVCKQGFICIPQFSLRRCRKDLNLSDVTDDTLVLRALRIFRLLRILHLCCTSCCHSVSNAGCPTHLNSTLLCFDSEADP